MRRFFLAVVVGVMVLCGSVEAAGDAGTVARWGVYEVMLKGPAAGNPFLEVQVSATFSTNGKSVEVAGFYDGGGVYRVRFMPEQVGAWHYVTHGSDPSLDKQAGTFSVTPAAGNDHGPVRVKETYHFAYADGTAYYPVGTTIYNWLQAPTAWQDQTIKTLSGTAFNKARFLVFPQNIDYAKNTVPPELNPFEGKPRKEWDYSRFNPAFFQNLERRVGQLRDMGIEADVILFNPYCSQWGFDKMDAATDDRYVRYMVARLAAYRNVWWSMANEFDHLKTKTMGDWDRYFQIVQKEDPYDHLRSVHNGYVLYDYTKPWVSHASLQNSAAPRKAGQSALQREKWKKPVVFDELNYEGTETRRWGQLKPEEMVRRIWMATVDGTYAEHGECYLDPQDTWLSYGGVLRGESWKRMGFLRKVLEEMPGYGIEPLTPPPPAGASADVEIGGQPGKYYLVYFGEAAPTSWKFALPAEGVAAGAKFKVEVLDTYGMTVAPVEGTFEVGKEGEVKLPGKAFVALRIMAVKG